MKHYILAKYKAEVTREQKERNAPKILALFRETLSIEGIKNVEMHTNCVQRENRYDLMIEIDMDREALEAYDACLPHKRWKETYGPLLEKKAIFDCE